MTVVILVFSYISINQNYKIISFISYRVPNWNKFEKSNDLENILMETKYRILTTVSRGNNSLSNTILVFNSFNIVKQIYFS